MINLTKMIAMAPSDLIFLAQLHLMQFSTTSRIAFTAGKLIGKIRMAIQRANLESRLISGYLTHRLILKQLTQFLALWILLLTLQKVQIVTESVIKGFLDFHKTLQKEYQIYFVNKQLVQS